MPYKLLIRLKNNTESPLEWVVLQANGKTESFEKTTENRKDLPGLAKNAQQILVLVPAEDILLTSIKLPKLSPGKLLKAIPYALEDQLTEDAANLHFATSQTEKGQPVTVAVVRRETMRHWQEILTGQLNAASAKVKVLVPDVLASPWKNNTFTILVQDGMAYVRTGHSNGFAIEKDTLFPILQLQLKRITAKPESINVYNAQNPIFTPEQTAQLGVPLVNLSGQTVSLGTMAETLREPYPVNLLQGLYAPRQKKASLEQLIWTGFALIGIWLLVVTVADLAKYYILRHENGIIDNQLQQIYTSVYPGRPIPKDPKSQMQKDLESLRAANADSAFTRLLNIVGPDIGKVIKSGVTVKSMTYRNNQLMLDMAANDLVSIENMQRSLEAQGYKATLSNAERGSSGMIETRLTVEEIS